jgi:hypothetical protein
LERSSNPSAIDRPGAARLAGAEVATWRSARPWAEGLMLRARAGYLRHFWHERAWRSYLALIAIFGCLAFVYAYRFSFGERDDYRVFDGVLSVFQRGGSLSSSLVYGYDISRGYFVCMEALRGLVARPLEIMRALNLVTFVFVTASLPAIAVLTYAFGGRTAGLAAIALVGVVPVWMNCSQYAHPMWPAIFFMLLSLAIASVRDRASLAWRPACDLIAVVAIGFAVSMRLDVLMMSPMYLGLCVEGDRFSLRRMFHWLAVGVVGVGCGLAVYAVTPAPGGPPLDIGKMLEDWNSPSRFAHLFLIAQLRVTRALGPGFIVAFLLAAYSFWRSRSLRLLLLTGPVVLINYLFWIPNPQPERHFLYLVPALVAALASLVGKAIETPSNSPAGAWSRRLGACVIALAPFASLATWSTQSAKPLYLPGLLVAIACFAACLDETTWIRLTTAHRRATAIALLAVLAAIAFVPERLLLHNPYSQDDPIRLGAIAAPLAALPKLDRPIAVVGDAYPIVAALLMNPRVHLTWSADAQWIYADTGANRFFLFIRGWVEDEGAPAVEALGRAQPIYAFVDPMAAPHVFDQLKSQHGVVRLAFTATGYEPWPEAKR